MKIIECKCGNESSCSSKCQCPNDVIDENAGWCQDEEGFWVRPDCNNEPPGTPYQTTE